MRLSDRHCGQISSSMVTNHADWLYVRAQTTRSAHTVEGYDDLKSPDSALYATSFLSTGDFGKFWWLVIITMKLDNEQDNKHRERSGYKP